MQLQRQPSSPRNQWNLLVRCVGNMLCSCSLLFSQSLVSPVGGSIIATKLCYSFPTDEGFSEFEVRQHLLNACHYPISCSQSLLVFSRSLLRDTVCVLLTATNKCICYRYPRSVYAYMCTTTCECTYRANLQRKHCLYISQSCYERPEMYQLAL